MGSKRRYTPIKDSEKAYHKEFDKLRMSSIILNKNARIQSDKIINFNSRTDLKKLLMQVEDSVQVVDDKMMRIKTKLKKADVSAKQLGKSAKPDRQAARARSSRRR